MQRSQELLGVYLQTVKDLQEGRITNPNDFLSNSDDVSCIGTDPGEWVIGRDNVLPFTEAQLVSFRDEGATFTSDNTVAWTEGDLGFVLDQLTTTLKDGRSGQLRMTCVYRKEDGTWKMVHQHASIGVPNERVEVFRNVGQTMAKA